MITNFFLNFNGVYNTNVFIVIDYIDNTIFVNIAIIYNIFSSKYNMTRLTNILIGFLFLKVMF